MAAWSRGGQVAEWAWGLGEGGEGDVKCARNGCVGGGTREKEGEEVK